MRDRIFAAGGGTDVVVLPVTKGFGPEAIEAALAQEAVRTTLARNAVVLRWRSSEDMKKFVAAEVQKWAEVVRISGAKADM